jgi:parallel beta-helix repeat protein
MAFRRRSIISVVVLLMLAGFVLLAHWYGSRHTTPMLHPAVLTLNVTQGGDRGPGSLREALFAADTANSAAYIVIGVNSITLESALPPIVNPHGIQIEAQPAGVEIDARAVDQASPVFDINAEHAAISGVTISHCPGSAVLVRAAQFRLSASSIDGCDVGVEIAGNASDVAIERNRFLNNHIGVRFSAWSRDTVIVKNEFNGNSTAGIWLVAAQPHAGVEPISVHVNQFRNGPTGVVVGNIASVLEHNDFDSMREAAIHVVGADAIVRENHISNGAAAGIVVEDAHGGVIQGNQLEHLDGYGILLRGSSDVLVRANRIQSCGYGLGFVLGDPHRPNTATDNALLDLKYNGIDVVGESPILRHNQVLQARAMPLNVQNFQSPNGQVTRAAPLLDRNSFQLGSAAVSNQVPAQR